MPEEFDTRFEQFTGGANDARKKAEEEFWERQVQERKKYQEHALEPTERQRKIIAITRQGVDDSIRGYGGDLSLGLLCIKFFSLKKTWLRRILTLILLMHLYQTHHKASSLSGTVLILAYLYCSPTSFFMHAHQSIRITIYGGRG